MSVIELIFLAAGLAMDAFAAAICKGLALKHITIKDCLIVGLWFGGFQAAMPVIGYLLGSRFSPYIEAFSAWIAFGLLTLIGGGMIKESFSKKDEDNINASLSFGAMIVISAATSIDALAVGITFAALKVNLWFAAPLIGVITLIISELGVKMGCIFGAKHKSKAEFIGGGVLILLGLKILLEHFGIL